MDKRSKLTEKQWEEIEQRMLEGEAGRVLAKEFKVSEGAIRKRKGTQVKQIKTVANQIVAAELAFRDLDFGTRESTQRYAAKMLSIQGDMLDGTMHAAATYRKLSAIASTEMQKVDVVAPMESADTLKTIALITRMANEAATVPTALLKASKEAMDDAASKSGRKLQELTDDELFAIATGSGG